MRSCFPGCLIGIKQNDAPTTSLGTKISPGLGHATAKRARELALRNFFSFRPDCDPMLRLAGVLAIMRHPETR